MGGIRKNYGNLKNISRKIICKTYEHCNYLQKINEWELMRNFSVVSELPCPCS